MDTLVLVHGFGSSARAWKPQVSALSGRFTVIAIDLPGHGNNNDPFTLKSAVDTVCDALGKGAHLVGISGGASVAMLTAIAMPKYVSTLFLSAPVAKTPPSFGIQRAITSAMPMAMIAATMKSLYSGGRPEYAETAAEDLRICGKDTIRAAFKKLSQTDLTEQLPQITSPTLVTCGANDTGSLAPARLVADTIPDSELRIIDNVGHFWNLEAPDLFNDIVLEFITANTN